MLFVLLATFIIVDLFEGDYYREKYLCFNIKGESCWLLEVYTTSFILIVPGTILYNFPLIIYRYVGFWATASTYPSIIYWNRFSVHLIKKFF